LRDAEPVITTLLLDPVPRAAESLARLCERCWRIEMNFDGLKTRQAAAIMRCKAPMLRRELVMHAIAYNVIRRLMQERTRSQRRLPEANSYQEKSIMNTLAIPNKRNPFRWTILLLSAWVLCGASTAQDSEGLGITGVSFSAKPGSEFAFLTWDSKPGKTYAIDSSTDLANWDVRTSGTPSGGASTSAFFPGTVVPAPFEYYRVRELPTSPQSGMVLIPAGAFTMGDNLDGSGGGTTVNVTVSAFFMDVNEVTLNQWQTVQQWATQVGGYSGLKAGSGKGASHPVHSVSWHDCVKWCNARSEREGKTPAYYTNDAQTEVYRTGTVHVTNAQVKWTANGYRLPTEAEWEKAARGGLNGKRFPWGDTISQKQANYRSFVAGNDLGPAGLNAIGSVGGTTPATSPVGSFAPNGYGLNDMAGNVFEWCWDWYGIPYVGGNDPKGADPSSAVRILRGGGWSMEESGARCASRTSSGPGNDFDDLGLRAVLPSGQ